jgi:hypothetical protein
MFVFLSGCRAYKPPVTGMLRRRRGERKGAPLKPLGARSGDPLQIVFTFSGRAGAACTAAIGDRFKFFKIFG